MKKNINQKIALIIVFFSLSFNFSFAQDANIYKKSTYGKPDVAEEINSEVTPSIENVSGENTSTSDYANLENSKKLFVKGDLDNPEEVFEHLQQNLFGNLVKYLSNIIVALAVLMLVYGGFRFMTARGNSDEIQKATGIIKVSLLGLFLMLFAYIIVSIVANLTSLAS